MRLIVLAAVMSACSWSQIVVSSSGFYTDTGMSTTDDGAHLYFSSSLRIKHTTQSPYPKILRWTRAGFELIAQEQPDGDVGHRTTNYYRLYNPRISGDGRTLAIGGVLDCIYVSSCMYINRTDTQIWTPAGVQKTDGDAYVSANGRFVVYTGTFENSFAGALWDVQTGEQVTLPDALAGPVTDDGRILTSSGFWSKSGSQSLPEHEKLSAFWMDRTGTTIAGWPATAEPYTHSALVSIDLATGHETVLVTSSTVSVPVLNRDGSLVLFVDGTMPDRQVYVVRTDGSEKRRLTSESDGIVTATLSGDGKVAYAVTGNSRVLRIDADTAAVEELSGETPVITATDRGGQTATSMSPVAVPGSLFRVSGTLLADRTFSIGGYNIALGNTSNSGFQFVLPDDFPVGTYVAAVSSGSAFESALSIIVQAHDPSFLAWPEGPWIHGDFSGFVDATRPAAVGETIVSYMNGLGDRQGFTCRVGTVDSSIPVDVLYAGPSGYAGSDQVNIRAPQPTQGTVMCGWFPTPWVSSLLAVAS